MEDYIKSHFQNFDAVVFFEKTAAQISRERATFQFEEAVDKLAEDTSNSYNLVSWCKNVQQSNYEIVNTDEAIVYWTNKEKATSNLYASLASSTSSRFVDERNANTQISVAMKSNTITRMKRKQESTNRRAESDKLLKLSLNSIVDLSDNSADGQKLYFDDAAWEEMKKCYRIKTPDHRHLKDYKKQLAKLNKYLKNMDLVKAYKVVRRLEIDSLDSIDEKVYKIYAYIIDVFRFNAKALLVKSNDPSELDYLMKIWGYILEALFAGQDNVRCKCDHLKLAVESKDILDFFVRSSSVFNHQTVSIPMIQLCANSCDVTKLFLADEGLYCIKEYYNLTLPLHATEFGKIADDWFHKLFSLRSHVLSLLQYLDLDSKSKTYNDHFARAVPSQEQTDYQTWIRGSFYPPGDDAALLIPTPDQLYGSDSNKRRRE
ncbi:hypothetical protein [Parasitella parasitica]|uniref:Uncharacterized protein n=1 Tax=Parasitella parasitica TaxID=35722 RepID=A0A0B7NEV9_9FUNG|nr:hypothetical protein [Parasitella parasitica]